MPTESAGCSSPLEASELRVVWSYGAHKLGLVSFSPNLVESFQNRCGRLSPINNPLRLDQKEGNTRNTQFLCKTFVSAHILSLVISREYFINLT